METCRAELCRFFYLHTFAPHLLNPKHNMKKQLLLAVFLLLILNAYGQSHKFEWAKSIGGKAGAEITYASVTDRSGNIYTTGTFAGTTDFDPGPGVYTATADFYDAYILKLDASGHFVWANTIPSTMWGGSYGSGIAVDTAGNVYVTGTYSDTISFDIGGSKTYAHTGRDNIFYAKLDADGRFVWAKTLNDSNGKGVFPSARNSKMNMDHSGNIILSAFFRGSIDVNSGADSFFVTSTGLHEETMVLKVNPSGEFTWAGSFSGTKFGNECKSLAITSKNDIVLAGYFDDTVDLDPGITKALHVSKGTTDMYVVMLDSLGNYVWSKSFGHKRDDNATAVALDQADNIYLAGHFSDTIEIATDTGMITLDAPFESAVTMKLDPGGNFKWFTHFGGWGSQKAIDLKLDKERNIYLLGDFRGSVDFDPGEDSFYVTGDYQTIFLTKCDSSGKFTYAKTFRPQSDVIIPPSLAVDTFKNVFLSGNFTERMDANPSIDSFILTSFDSDDLEAFTIKLGSCTPSAGKDSIVACGSFTIARQTFTESGLYKKELISSSGCDSMLTFKLTILPKPEVHTTYISINTLSASTSGTSYQWVKCPSYTPIPGETNKTYTATADGYYSVIVSNGSCTDTAACNYIKAPVSIREWEAGQDKVTVSPNPFSNKATVTFESSAKDIVLNLYNQMGQLQLSLPAQNNAHVIEIERGFLLPGIYFYQLTHAEGVLANGKLMIAE